MAIFARLFCMVVSVVVFSIVGGILGRGWRDVDNQLGMGIGAAAGAFLGVAIGKRSGEAVAGPPPKD